MVFVLENTSDEKQLNREEIVGGALPFKADLHRENLDCPPSCCLLPLSGQAASSDGLICPCPPFHSLNLLYNLFKELKRIRIGSKEILREEPFLYQGRLMDSNILGTQKPG